MTSETDEQFLRRIADYGLILGFDGHDIKRLRNLARRGAEAADRIEQLEAALRWVSLQHYTDQRTVTPEIAHQAYRPLIAHVNAICDKARAALEASDD